MHGPHMLVGHNQGDLGCVGTFHKHCNGHPRSNQRKRNKEREINHLQELPKHKKQGDQMRKKF